MICRTATDANSPRKRGKAHTAGPFGVPLKSLLINKVTSKDLSNS